MEKQREIRKEYIIASRLGNTAVNLSSVIMEIAEQMLSYCKENRVHIDYYEKKQWLMLIKCTRALDSMVLNQGRDKIALFRRNVKIFSLLMRLILARVDDDDMKLYQWYNYIKTFPTDFPEIQPTAKEEREAFKHIFQ